MTLKELQGMIKEEFEALQNEAMDDVDVSVSGDDVDATEGDDSMEMLKKIYDMLKDKFEAEEGGEDMDNMDEEMTDEAMDEAMDKEMTDEAMDEDMMDENATTDAKFQKTGMAPMSKGSAGSNVGFDNKAMSGRTGYDAGSKALQERFQTLANIIK